MDEDFAQELPVGMARFEPYLGFWKGKRPESPPWSRGRSGLPCVHCSPQRGLCITAISANGRPSQGIWVEQHPTICSEGNRRREHTLAIWQANLERQ
jgi:hypothetical protein